jgi:DNA uptake protein ComE-like DNA-binding protein
VSNVALAGGGREAENGVVRLRGGFSAAGIAILSVCLAGVSQSAVKKAPVPPAEARVDINHASIPELLKVPGMTASWAGRIVRFRPYWTKQDLVDHGVVTSEVYDRIKDYVIARREKPQAPF